MQSKASFDILNILLPRQVKLPAACRGELHLFVVENDLPRKFRFYGYVGTLFAHDDPEGLMAGDPALIDAAGDDSA